MKISKVYLKNFRGYGEADTEDRMYQFTHLDDADTVIFTGYNGFGKTGFFEAIEWCLTGKIRDLQETNLERYDKTTMRNSSYLKFQRMGGSEEREVIVCVAFDNNWGIIRSTKCNSLEELNYSDSITNLDGIQISQEHLNSVLKQSTGQMPEQMLKLSFNGQNRNSDFVKSVKAKDRTGTLLEFMGLKLISDIVDKSDSNKNRKLKQIYEVLTTKYNNTKNDINNIEQIFLSNQWGTIKEYMNTVQIVLTKLNTVQEELKREGLIKNTILLTVTDFKDLIDSFEKVKVLMNKLESQYSTNEKQIMVLTKGRLIYIWKKIQQFLLQANLVKKTDLQKIQAEQGRYELLLEMYQTSIKQLEDIKRSAEIETIIPEPLKMDGEIGIALEEKTQYTQYLSTYKKLQNIFRNYSVGENHQYDIYSIEKEFSRSEKYVGFLKSVESKINLEKQHLKELGQIFSGQRELLMQVQDYVNKLTEVNSCPVCGGTEFKKGEKHDGKEELLEIISLQIADGNAQMKTKNDTIVKQEKRLIKFREKINKTIRARYQINVNGLFNEIKCLKTDIITECERRISCNQLSYEKFGTLLSAYSSKISQIQEFMSQYKTIDIESIILKKEKQKEKIENVFLKKFLVNNMEEIVQEWDNNVVDRIMPYFGKRYLLRKAKTCVDNILKYDVGAENLSILKDYEKKCEEQDRLEVKKVLLKKAIEFRGIINKNSKTIREEILDALIENNEMINWIYGKINPHPFFREIKLNMGKNKTDIISAERKEVYLDHIFSEAQMNVLSLSIFLGLVLSVRNYGFKQIYLDDPVQSLDDINEVSFIDLLRALIQSKEVDKNCIISTHDHNFGKLMKIKLRNYKFVEYRFESYGIEGPRIKMVVNNI